jgi:hypothetical protein
VRAALVALINLLLISMISLSRRHPAPDLP